MARVREEKEFNITNEEVNKLEECMKKKEFRDLLVEYAKEISDPENRKKYEEEIARMEQDRGRDVKFVNPEDGFVVKTTRKNDGLKAFVNVCFNQYIEKATAEDSERNENGRRKVGQQWHIPYSLSHARDDLDNAGKKCIVYDAVFNPETYKKGMQDSRFKKLLIDTALEGIERQHSVKLDKKNLKFPKLKFKGMKQATIIRTQSAQKVKSQTPPDQDIGGSQFPYPYPDSPTPVHKEEKKKGDSNKYIQNEKKATSSEPVYRIIHRGHIDFQNFTCARDSNVNMTRPKELVVYIELPLKNSAQGLDLDIFEKQLLLDCKNPSYHLDINLPYSVDEENGSAKFDKSKKQLVVTLPVQLPTCTQTNIPQNLETSEPNEICNAKENCLKSVTQEDEEKVQTDNGPTATCESSTHSTYVDDSVSDEDKSAATTNKFSPDSIVSQNNKDNELELEFDDSECDELPELVPMEEEETEVSSPPPEFAEVDEVKFDVPSSLKDNSYPLFFKCPPYTYHQDEETVTFVINVPNLSLEDISLGFNSNKCYISFPSATGGTPHQLSSTDYALYISFPERCSLDTDRCHIDVSNHNVVLLLQKSGSSQGLWESFRAGAAEECLEEKYFLTVQNVDVLLQEITEHDPWETGPVTCKTDVQVTSVSDEHLTIELESHLTDSGENVKRNAGKESSLLNPEREERTPSTTASQKLTSAEKQLNGKNDSEMIEKCYQGLQNSIENLANKARSWSLSSDGENELNNAVSQSDTFQTESSVKTPVASSEAIPKETKRVSFDQTAIENAKKIRKSCLRRTSSTCSEESLGEYSSDTSGTEGSLSESPRKNVRFNFNPEVRVFSNKKDKKRRKRQAKLRKEKEAAEKAKQAEQKEAANKVANGVETKMPFEEKNYNIEINGETDSPELIPSGKKEPVLRNSLIFDLDD